MPPDTPRDVRCPTCDAPPREGCAGTEGIHQARWDRWEYGPGYTRSVPTHPPSDPEQRELDL